MNKDAVFAAIEKLEADLAALKRAVVGAVEIPAPAVANVAAGVIDNGQIGVVIGREVVITGEIVSVKFRDGQYPGFKMVVLDDRGFKVWGSLPKGIDADTAAGRKITFTAEVTASDDDPQFGFFRRPKNALLVSDEFPQQVMTEDPMQAEADAAHAEMLRAAGLDPSAIGLEPETPAHLA